MARVPPTGGRKHPNQEYIQIDTANILFICGGAFVGLRGVYQAAHRAPERGYRAINAQQNDATRTRDGALAVEPEDLIRYGIIPEFVGRIPVTCSLASLTEDDLVRILTEPRNCMTKQYQKLLALESVSLEFEPEALRAMARIALERKTGARGLRAIMERLMMELMYEAPGRKDLGEIVITEELVKAQLEDPGALVRHLKSA